MIEIFIRRFYPTFPSRDYDDELLYIGHSKEEAQAAFSSRVWAENELGIWQETDKNSLVRLARNVEQ